MRKYLLLLPIAMASTGTVHSAVYSTEFDDDFVAGKVAGQAGWAISGADISTSPGATRIVTSPFSSSIPPNSGTRAASMGWDYINPGATSVYLYHGLDAVTPLVGNGASYSEFKVTMLIQDSSWEQPNRDKFGFTLRDDAGDDIFTIMFSPQSPAVDPDASTRIDNVSVLSDYGLTLTNPLQNPNLVGSLTERSYTTLDLTFTQGTGGAVNFTFKSAGVMLTQGSLAGAAGANINTFGALWVPLDPPTNTGDNLLIFDDLSMVPEPSSMLLGLLGASLVCVRRRRA